MQVVFEVLGAPAASMAVIDAKDLQLRPLVSGYPRSLLGRLDHVKYDRDSILVGLAHDADICVCCEGPHHAKGLRADLARLEERQRRLWLVLLEQLGYLLLDTLGC